MTPIPRLLDLAGKWHGSYKLTVEPAGPVRTSDTRASVAPVAQGRFARIDYAWDFEGKLQDGSIVVGYDDKRDVVTALWVDSWHMSDKVMVCEGRTTAGGIDVRGAYAAPPGPDWGWRTVIERAEDDSLRMVMYNVTPDGTEVLAVEADYRRSD